MKPDFSGKREIYLEVAEKYESYIRIGILSPGEAGLIYTLPKKGVYVARLKEAEQKEDTLTKEARAAIQSLKDRGLTRETLDTLISEVYGK